MNIAERIRIIPVLILVAMLAFSVRIIDVVSGVQSFSGMAYALEDSADDHGSDKAMDKHEDEGQKGLLIVEDNKPMKLEGESEEGEGEEPVTDWVDASDANFEFAETRMAIFQEITEQKKALDQKQRGLETREALLQAAEQELDRKFQELSQLRNKIESLLETQSEEEKARITSLVRIYEGMKSKQAARIFDTLDLDILVAVMSQMSERKVSPVLAEMNPERARTVTILLAEEKKLPELPQGN